MGTANDSKENRQELAEQLKRYADRCWDHHKLYKEAQEKLLYFIATIFTLVVSASGIFGAAGNKDLHFTLIHIGLFHTLFLIVWLFYLYKKICSDMYMQIARSTDEFRDRCFPKKIITSLPKFSEIKSDFLGASNSLTTGRSFANYAGVLIILMYLGLCVLAVTTGNPITSDGIKIEWPQFTVITPFIAILIVVQLIFGHQSKLIQQRIRDRWDVLVCPV